MENPETGYARTADGVYLAYQTLGHGPLDIVWQPDWPGNIDFEWDLWFGGVSFIRELASFSRVSARDQRGIGALEPQRRARRPRDPRGGRSSSVITRRCDKRSSGGTAPRWTRPATGSTRPSRTA